MNVLIGVCVEGILLVHASESFLQVEHQLDLRIETSHITDRLIKVKRVILLREQYRKIISQVFDAELCQHFLLILLFSEFLFVKVELVDLVA